MKTLIIYDNDGVIIDERSGIYKIPNGLPYLEIEIPKGKRVISIDVETKEPIYVDIPKSQTEILEDKISILEEENADLLLDSATKDAKLSALEKDLADLTVEVIKGGM